MPTYSKMFSSILPMNIGYSALKIESVKMFTLKFFIGESLLLKFSSNFWQ